jgi:DNA replication protein DnaC
MTDSTVLHDCCKMLHISTVYSLYLENYQNNFEVTRFLMEALTAECQARKSNRQMKALKSAGFPTPKRFEDLQVEALPDDGRIHLSGLQSLDFLKQHKNVILIGNSGTGKTHFAIATGIAACMSDYKVIFRTAAMLVNELYEAKRQGKLTWLVKQIQRTDLLIIDELGYISFDMEGAELLFQLLAARYETQSTFITSNLMFSDWINVFQNKVLTSALLDRITHRAIILNMSGMSFRRREE